MSMHTYIKPDPSGNRMFFMDSFYGIHKVEDVTKIVTNGEERVICTMKLLFVNRGDKYLVKYVLNHIKKLSQGTWFLLWVTVDGFIQNNCGYIFFKDKRPVLFYTNDLKDTPTKIIQGVTEESVICVGGLLILKRWTDECTTTSKSFYVPSIIVAYNHLMNGVDIFDQVHTYSACVCKEKRFSMTILDFILD